MVSYSEVSTFRNCALKWHLGYQVGLRPPERIARLDLGSAWDLVLNELFGDQIGAGEDEIEKRALRGEVKARWAIANIEDLLPGAVYEKEPEPILHWMLDGYLEMWRERDYEFEVLAVQQKISIPTGLRTGNETVRFHGYVDAVLRNRKTGKIRLRDAKSASGRDLSSQSWARELQLDDQFGLYPYVMRRMGYDVDTIEYDGARVDKLKREMTPVERFNRVGLYRSPGELDVLWVEFLNGVREMLATERGTRPITSNPNPMECRWKCSFMDSHLMGRMNGGDYENAARGYGFTDRKKRASILEAEASALGVKELF